MRLLVITNNPETAGFRHRIGVYLSLLRDHGLHCELAPLPAGEWRRWQLFRHAASFDGVLVHKKKFSWWDALWLRRHSRRLIYTFDDAIMIKDRRPEVYSRSHFVPFRRMARLADLIIVGSSYLAERARPFNARVEVLPLGLPVEDYGMAACPPGDGNIRLVWIGSRSTLGYLNGVAGVMKEIGARFPQAVLRLISDEFVDVPGIPVEKVVWSLENRRTGLATSDIGLAPMPDDSFTRGKCTFKVLEYSASGLPVIASAVGTNVEHVVDGVTGFLVTKSDEWLGHAARLVEDADLRRRMGAQGRMQAARYDAQLIGPRLAAILRQCLAGDSVDSIYTSRR